MTAATILDGLPAYGPLAIGFPEEWGKLGREGIVVRFASDSDEWSGNFRPGLKGLTSVGPHPNGRDVLVIAQDEQAVLPYPMQIAKNLSYTLVLSRKHYAARSILSSCQWPEKPLQRSQKKNLMARVALRLDKPSQILGSWLIGGLTNLRLPTSELTRAWCRRLDVYSLLRVTSRAAQAQC
jgi:hypothetical protein